MEQEEQGIVEAEAVENEAPQEAPPDQGGNPQEAQKGGPARAILTAAKRIIYDPKVSPELVKIIQSAPDPVQGIAQACLMVLRIIHSETKGAKGMGSAALAAVIPMVIELAVKSGLVEPSKELGAQVLEALKALVMQQKQAAGPAEQQQPAPPQGGAPAPQPGAPPMGAPGMVQGGMQ